ncbi:MAG TPA: c-type cytochrome, partial [Gemmatimonadaceae bacterium]|nr:c-type cytochrome [Gemmatimonadaceae bacterium]
SLIRARARAGIALAVLAALACRARPTPDDRSAEDRVRLLADTAFPATPFGVSARRGLALMAHTPDSLPAYAHSALRCMSCHLDDGSRAHGLMLLGVAARYPQYRSRSGHLDLLSDRINDCFKRSLAGAPLPVESAEMRDIVAYLTWISRGVGILDSLPGQGLVKLPSLPADTARGAAVFATACARCHGAGGAGGEFTRPVPPLWGDRSFSIGAGMARARTLAAFVRENMPFDKPGTLTDQQAIDVAAFVAARPRPDLAGKEADWPNGDPPADVAYPTTAAAKKAAAIRTTPTGAH